MGPERANKPVSARRMPSVMLHDKKKVVLAVGLAVVMGIMWVRVLVGHKPQAAAAAAVTSPPSGAASESKAPTKLRFFDLPVIPGRNDAIDRDFFTVRDWSSFSSNAAAKSADTEGVRSPGDRTSEGFNRVTQKLKLQAVLLASKPMAYINDHLLHVGETLTLRDGADLYVFEVTRIGREAVQVECDGKQVTLKMEQSQDVEN
jgi:hypothetical protein